VSMMTEPFKCRVVANSKLGAWPAAAHDGSFLVLQSASC
jgi:hypothetical protein